MGNLASPLQFAAVASALAWPLAAGVAVVVCSKMRAAHARRAAMEGRLKGIYRTLESAPVTPQLAMVMDALEEGEELAGGAAKTRSGKATPAAGS